MKKIRLSKKNLIFAKVDDVDYKLVSQYKWHWDGKYAKGEVNGKITYMHRLIMNFPKQVDHINSDRLDNRRKNLRISDSFGNARNKVSFSRSGFKGVRKQSLANTYMARICVDKKEFYLGSFSTAVEAAKAYNRAARKYFGEFAKLNKIKRI